MVFNRSVDDRALDLDFDGLTNVEEYLYGIDPEMPNADKGILSETLFNRINWYQAIIDQRDLNEKLNQYLHLLC